MTSPGALVPSAAQRVRALAPVLAVGAVVLLATGYLAAVDPHEPGHYPTCPTLALSGFFCAGCGALRAVHSLTRLDVAGAWGMNPLLVLALPVLVWAWVAWGRRAWTGRSRGAPLPAPLVWALFAVVIGYSVLRNVPALAPWLAP